MPTRSQGTELQGRQQVIALEIGVVLEHVFDRHARREELEKILDRITQTSNRRLPVATETSDVMRSRRNVPKVAGDG